MPLQILHNWPHVQLSIIRRDPARHIFGEQLGARHRPQRQGQADRVKTNLDQLTARLLAQVTQPNQKYD
jgi:hypothetical protein